MKKIDIHTIRKHLPHRYPFLMIDQIEEATSEKVIATKNISINEPQFQGHFPDYPIMPGVLIAECMFQASAFLGFLPDSITSEDKQPLNRFVCTGMNIKFKSSVFPGDRLNISVKLVKAFGDMSKVHGRISTEKSLVAEGTFNLTIQRGNLNEI